MPCSRHASYGRLHPLADCSGHTPTLAHREADATSNVREAEMHDGRVRLGPSAAFDHYADDLVVGAVVCLVPVALQQPVVLEGVHFGERPLASSVSNSATWNCS
jgi:hypothetical protein